jgi:hypothetical protein
MRRSLAGVLAGYMAIAIGLLAVWAAPAAAAAPANDDFANRQALSGSLPIEVPGSNFEATKEAGEFLNLFAAAGHSIWFEWTAPATEWVTVGGCNPDGDFREVLGVYTGSSVNTLTRVAAGNASEGPHCPFSQREYTFKATSGAKYEIAVDGNVFGFPDQPPPVTEGTMALRIEATPVPVNDNFDAATVLAAPIGEEPGGDRYYFASTNGYNWKATTETGEPDDGTSHGASVWYVWTAPETATYHFSGPCCGTGLSWGAYAGDSVDALTPILVGAEFAEAFVTAGTTYRIVVDGDFDPAAEEPRAASFNFSISANLPPRPAAPPPSAGGSVGVQPDLVAPETTLAKAVLKRLPPKFVFHFNSNEPGSVFRCRLDRQPFRTCVPPKSFGNLDPGRHTFRVKAVDAAGNEDPTPALIRFRIPENPRRLHR